MTETEAPALGHLVTLSPCHAKARYRERNERRHIAGFTAGQRIALDRAWQEELQRRKARS